MWRDQLLAQLEFYWSYHLRPRLERLTDEEYFWEPVPGCWSIREVDGAWQIDWAWPTPDPAPVTTIAWRLAHIGSVALGIRWSSHFGDGSHNLETIAWPSSADQAVTELERFYRLWVSAVRELDEEALARPVGPKEGQWADEPFAGLVFHLNREVMHHGGEICLLRDLYRARFSTT
jgi:hypothetical protein